MMTDDLMHLTKKLEFDDPKAVAAEFKINSWILTKLKSEEFGDKVTVQHDVLNLTTALTKAIKRVTNESRCDSGKLTDSQSADIIEDIEYRETDKESDIDPFS
jgi:hypothetical protein